MPQIVEAGALTRATERAGNMLVQLITPGQGSSGTYTAEVLQEAATSRAFPAGTLMFADHPGEAETYDRPERSIRDVAGVLVEDARWDGAALVAEAKTYEPWTKVLGEMKDAIGVSIRATADVAEGAVKAIHRGISVDFVTQAGRGGKIREVYESARAEAPLLVLGEASASQTRDRLHELVRATYGESNADPRSYAYVRDYDPEQGLVWFEVETSGQPTALWQQGYTLDADEMPTLQGARTQVVVKTEYVPIGTTTDVDEASPKSPVTPAGSTKVTHESEEDTMQQIEESRLAQLEADAGRVPTLESEREASNAERDAERAARVAAENRAAAVEAIADSGHDFTRLERRGLLASLPVTEAGELDAEQFAEQLTEAATESRSTAGTGEVRGFGGTTTDTDKDYAAEADQAVAGAFGRNTRKEA